jgi:hypothetical protein
MLIIQFDIIYRVKFEICDKIRDTIENLLEFKRCLASLVTILNFRN